MVIDFIATPKNVVEGCGKREEELAKKYQLNELLAAITDESLHPEMDWGSLVGLEVWEAQFAEGVSEEQLAELRRRIKAYQDAPQIGKPWETVRENLPRRA